MSTEEPFLHIDSLNIHLDKFSLDNVSLSCQKDEYHILMGPSGSGKSTLMRCLLGFHRIHSGKISLGNRNITNELPEHRRMGYVPQNYALFPHLNVEENLKFALQAGKKTTDEINAIVNNLCDILKIEKLRTRQVTNLSGGEQQKVALGRALAAQPELILLDEPFSSIDESAKRGLWFELKQIVKEVGITTIHITHNLEEAYTLGENLSVLIGGELVQSGPKKEIFDKPKAESVARYLNYSNIFEGTSESLHDGTRIHLENFSVVIGDKIPEGKKRTICVRQQDIKIVRKNVPLKNSLKRNVFSGSIVELLPLPEFCLMRFRLDNSNNNYDMELKFPTHIIVRQNLHIGKKVDVAMWEPKIILFE
jgi:ABC-type Fe3+/spermidine/putrescine transport system ATPase subunit